MNKQKAIEDIAKILCDKRNPICKDCGIRTTECDCYDKAHDLINAGYGDVKAAVREFAEKVETIISTHKYEYSHHVCKSEKEAEKETWKCYALSMVAYEIKKLLKEH